jgi:hypothetical protein
MVASFNIRGIGASLFRISQIMTPAGYFSEIFLAAAASGNCAKPEECSRRSISAGDVKTPAAGRSVKTIALTLLDRARNS